MKEKNLSGFGSAEAPIRRIMNENQVPPWLTPVSPEKIFPDATPSTTFAIPLEIPHGALFKPPPKEATQWLAQAKQAAGIEPGSDVVILMQIQGVMDPQPGKPSLCAVYQPVEREILLLTPEQLKNQDAARVEINTEFTGTQYQFACSAKTGISPTDGIHYPRILSLEELKEV